MQTLTFAPTRGIASGVTTGPNPSFDFQRFAGIVYAFLQETEAPRATHGPDADQLLAAEFQQHLFGEVAQ